MKRELAVYKLSQKRDRGDWYAMIEGFGRLPVGHDHCVDRTKTRYLDPGDGTVSRLWRRWIGQVQAGHMIIQVSKMNPDTGKLFCAGYVGLFKVSDAELSRTGAFSANIEQIGVIE